MNVDVFFDLDGCLVNARYGATVPAAEVKRKIASLATHMRFHLNSNRSRSTLEGHYEGFGFNGYLILENGCYYVDPVNSSESASCAEPFPRTTLERALDVPVHFVDTDEIVRGRRQDLPNGPHAFGEMTRRHTMTVYPRQIVDGEVLNDELLLTRLGGRIDRALPDYEVTVDPITYRNILIKPKGVLKSTLISVLSRPAAAVASFGDSQDDICMFNVSTFCGAPANASPEAKQAVIALGGIVTTGEYTEGAMEFLSALSERFPCDS